MPRRRPDDPGDFDHLLLLADADDSHRDAVLPHLSALPGAAVDAKARGPGRRKRSRRRFRILTATDGDQALALAGPELTVAAIELVLPRVAGLEVIQSLRSRSADLAILAFTAVAPPSEAVAAVMAGADYFLEWRDDTTAEALAAAIELAIDRRRLSRVIERGEAEIGAARGRLAQLSGELARVLPSGAPISREDVLPFDEAARRYLAGAARLFEGSAPELARRLGISYFALRRLLARYGVPFPKRTPGRRPRR
jgi:DNA-binding NtrC family response regulator